MGMMGTFHLVDMPGLGYAKAPGAERRRWLDFIGVYAARRPQLRLVVHLIDGQVGPMETDLAIMKMMRAAAAGEVAEEGEAKEVEEVEAADVAAEEEGIVLESREIDGTGTSTGISTGISTGGTGGWEYAICLTKSDKSGPKGIKRVENAVQRAVEKTGCPVPVGLVTTSSKSKGGRADMWRLMRRVVLEGGESSEGADDTA